MPFDADTVFNTSWIYAKVFVSADGNAWEQVFETADFTIHGSDPNDDYEVETELVSGYSTGLYDVLIELYDADDEHVPRRVRPERVVRLLAAAARGLRA